MLEASAERERRATRLQASFVANIINLAGRKIKRACTVEALLGLPEPGPTKKKKGEWRTAADVIREDQERARRAAERDAG